MKSTLFAAAAAFLLSTPALAAPKHLTCSSDQAETSGEPFTRQVLVDSDTGLATVSSTSMKLTSKPNELVLHYHQDPPDFDLIELVIDRKTLAFEYKRSMWPAAARSVGAGMTRLEYSGHCQVTAAPAGNQI